jgi:hypothetical protein
MNLPLSTLSPEGIEILWKHIDECRLAKREDRPQPPIPRNALLNDHSHVLLQEVLISDTEVFAGRYEFGVYINTVIGNYWADPLLENPGLWTWLAVVYWDQFTKGGVNRQEHYIPMIPPYHGRLGHDRIDYRQCARTPVQLVRRFGEDARFFLSGRPINEMGDIVEQTISRQDIFGNERFIRTIISHFRTQEGLPKKGAASEPKRKKLKNGKWSTAGRGGIRRLVTAFLPRIKLTYNVYELTSDEIIDLAGNEFSQTK